MKNSIHPEKVIRRSGNGIELSGSSQGNSEDNLTVSRLLQLPCNVYFLNSESVIQATNEHMVKNCGFVSEKDAVGRSIRDTAKKEIAEYLIQNDLAVMKTHDVKMTDDQFHDLKNASSHTAVSIKFPWYDNRNKIIGVFGCSIVLGQQLLSETLDEIRRLGLLSLPSNTNSANLLQGSFLANEYYSKRQRDCLRLLVCGKTAKEIGKTLGLSHRTVEHYLEIIKKKMKVRTKSELIEKTLEIFCWLGA